MCGKVGNGTGRSMSPTIAPTEVIMCFDGKSIATMMYGITIHGDIRA